jgi:tRNA-2-methylthio-N6-dimethylallyladenosine synthase
MISVFFKTYGCLANVADSELLAKYMRGLGCVVSENESEADLIIVNTCAIREKAEHKLFSYVGRLAEYVKNKPHLKVGIIGCVTSYRKSDFFEKFSFVNFAFGAKNDLEQLKAYIADLIIKIETEKQFYPVRPEGFSEGKMSRRVLPNGVQALFKSQFKVIKDKNIPELVEKRNLKIPEDAKIISDFKHGRLKRSVINIMTGCNNYCTYCIVPFTRGREKSFEMEAILERVKKELDAGAKEINLLGQNVNSYCDPKTGADFATLLENVAKLDGEFWVRFTSPHPKDTSKKLLQVMAKYSEKLCAWIHLPLQSGSDNILKRMNRTYTSEQFLEKVNWIREFLPDAIISTDIILGFPGETEEDYQKTLDMLETVRFAFSFSFIYSPRKYTKAAAMEDNCPHETKLKRLEYLQKRQKEISKETHNALVGKTIKVLVENVMPNGMFFAKTAGNIRVSVRSDNKDIVNKFIMVKIDVAREALVEATAINF